ncbi:HYC_CC_PP family protein [Fibrella aquatica]|uniref:HYC_CC_PP family protein n=1 Tax=Fibrella aquatica TaxID=3242487 RepID=UPI0035219E08
MRTPLHTQLICCWLAILVLVSSMGFGMVEHWCQLRGHSKTLLEAQRNCPKHCQSDEVSAPVSGEPIVKRAACCKTTLTYEHLDVSSFVADYHPLPAPQPADFLPNPQFRLLLAALLPSPSAKPVPSLADTPLYRTGRFRLTSLCTWLI